MKSSNYNTKMFDFDEILELLNKRNIYGLHKNKFDDGFCLNRSHFLNCSNLKKYYKYIF